MFSFVVNLKNMSYTELSSVGEFGLIEHLTKNITLKHKSTIKGVGDDAAVIGEGKTKTLITTDLLVEGIHFDLMYSPYKHLGYKAIAVNLSDIYAMNGTPKQVTVSLALSNHISVEALNELYEGIYTACDKYNVDLIGGDTTSSQSGLMISVTAIGEANEEEIVYRNGAKINDLICVSGDLGGAYIGLQILEREKKLFKENPKIQPDLENYEYIVERQLKPEPRKDVIDELKKLGIKPTSMIDISDGLSSELIHIGKQSDVGMRIVENKLPIDQQTFSTAEQLNIHPATCALNGGEDYELLFTIPVNDFEKIKGNKLFREIGFVPDVKEKYEMLTNSGSFIELTAQGWKSF